MIYKKINDLVGYEMQRLFTSLNSLSVIQEKILTAMSIKT